MNTTSLSSHLNLEKYTSKTGKNFWFKDNGGTVLMVAHADTVKRPGVFQPVNGRDDTRIFSPTWDDRVGVYVYTYLKKMGLKIDFLLTEGEEKGKSTALWFQAPKKYNWMFMFDRRSTGAVAYQYLDNKLQYRLGKHNFNVGIGSYSCIRDLEHLGVQGINFGSGYHENHSEWAYLSVKELRSQLRKFLSFHKEFKNVRMLHDLGYEEFAKNVMHHSYENTREEQEENFMIPALSVRYKDPYQLTQGSEDIEDAEFEIMEVAPDIPDFQFDDWGEMKAEEIKKVQEEVLEESKAMMLVDEHGILRGLREDRDIHKLYWPVEVLSKHDQATKNILRNTFGCKYYYDIVKLSPRRLCARGNLTLYEADKLKQYMVSIGFNMPYNLQGFKTPDVWYHEAKGNSFNRRKIISSLPEDMRKDVAKKAKKFLASKKAKDFIEKYEKPSEADLNKITILKDKVRTLESRYDRTEDKGWKTRLLKKLKEAKENLTSFKAKIKSLLKKTPDASVYGPQNYDGCIDDKFKSGKYIQLFPLPDGKGNYEELIQTARELRSEGEFDLDVMFTCNNCRKSIVFDVDRFNQLPKVCEDCKADLDSEEEHFMSPQMEIPSVPSNTILTKVQLKKDNDDDSVYKYTGKSNGEKGVDKYAWSSREQVGFVREDA